MSATANIVGKLRIRRWRAGSFGRAGDGRVHSGNAANTALLSSAACQANGSGENATAVGAAATASGVQGTALGAISDARGENATAVGFASGGVVVAGATTVGAHSGFSSAGYYSTAVGAGASITTGATAAGAGSIAVGGGDASFPGARASGAAAVAVGNRSVAGGEGYGSAFGYNARADVSKGGGLEPSDADGPGRLALEVDDDEVLARVEDLPEMVIPMAT